MRLHGAEFTSSFVNTTDTFETTGYFADRSLFSPGINGSWILWHNQLCLDLYYNGEFCHNFNDNSFGAQVRYAF